jgi:hypothetical protein
LNYFVTGATGFVGRHPGRGAPEARRDHLRARPRGLPREGRGPGPAPRGARGPHRAGARRPVEAGARRREVRRADRPPLPPRRRLRRRGPRRGDVRRQRRGHPPRGRVRERAAGGALPPRQLDRGRRQVPRRLSGGHVRGGAGAAARLPTARSTSRRRSRATTSGRSCSCFAPGSWSATRRRARWTRSTAPTTSSSCSSACAAACPNGSRSPVPREERRTSSRWTSSPGRWTTSLTSQTTSCRATPSTS